MVYKPFTTNSIVRSYWRDADLLSSVCFLSQFGFDLMEGNHFPRST
jgi:hypothetical protein